MMELRQGLKMGVSFLTREHVATWRGTDLENARCDICGAPDWASRLEPEESSMWVCLHCQWRWDTNEIHAALQTLGL
jgi:ribosomal protein L37AE/L43A